MTDFLIKSTLSMAVLLAVYHLFLEREKMHRFNRFYLLGALVLSLVLPFITIEIIKEVAAEPMPQFSEIPMNVPAPIITEQVNYLPYIIVGIYCIVTLLLLVRFGHNLLHFKRQVRQSKTIAHEGAVLVLLVQKVIPHTFLNYIFVSKDEHEQNTIEQELYTHELAHVRQRHSLDILFTEVLRTILWFNPLLYFYKKAIQLNHEFLADESVVNPANVTFYQKLLLQKAVPATTYQLASSLNFSVTKKRFKMMTKATPKRKALLLKLAALPVVAGLIYALCTETVAQNIVTKELEVAAITLQNQGSKTANEDAKRDRYYAGVHILVKSVTKGIIIDKPYEQLTEEEKDKYLNPVPLPAQKKQLSAKLYNDLKDKNSYAVFIDGKHIDNTELNKFTPEDFASYFGSSVYKNARSKKFPQAHQFRLYTHKYFDKNLKNSYKKFGSQTYTVVTGSYVKSEELQPAKVKPEEVTILLYNDNLPKGKNANDTIKKLNERAAATQNAKDAEVNARKAKVNAAIAKVNANKAAADRNKAKEYQAKALANKNAAVKATVVYQEDKIYQGDDVTAKPDYPGGLMEFYKFVNTNFNIPKELTGSVRIYVSFIVEKDGSLSTMKIMKDPGHGAGDETLRVLKLSKKWVPASVDGKPVRYNFYLPISLNIK
jgi:beta-lactamase regulating signal transducer with metallopeptidase domain